MYIISGVKIFTKCSKYDNQLTRNLSDLSYACTRCNNLSKLKSYLTRLNPTETSRGFLSLTIFL